MSTIATQYKIPIGGEPVYATEEYTQLKHVAIKIDQP
jgi:hypothetical protein